jgi:hypothetical protein
MVPVPLPGLPEVTEVQVVQAIVSAQAGRVEEAMQTTRANKSA